MKKYMTTTTMALILPEFKDQFGEGKKVDLIFSLNQAYMEHMVPEIEKSAFEIKENGVMGVNFNFGIQIIVESSFGKWEEARAAYVTFELKIQAEVKKNDEGDPEFHFKVRTIDFPLLKIFKGDSEEMFLEEMLIQGMLNVQIELLKEKMGKIQKPLRDISKYKELQCLGVMLKDLNITYEDSYAIIHSDYDAVKPDGDYCDQIEQGFKDAPLKAMEEFDTPLPGMSGKLPGMQDFKEFAEKISPKIEENKKERELKKQGEERMAKKMEELNAEAAKEEPVPVEEPASEDTKRTDL